MDSGFASPPIDTRAAGFGDRPVTVVEPPALSRLHPLRALARLPVYADLLRTLSVHRVNVRYKQSALGLLWALLQPLAMMLVFTLMFSFIGAPSQGIPYAVFAYAALLPWSAFSNGLSSASGALTSHASLVTKVAFPREILPLTYVIAALADLAIASTALAALMLWYHVRPTTTIVWIVPALALLVGFLTACSLVVSAVQVRFRDVGLAMPVILQIWMFASPVLYPLSAVHHKLPPSLYALYLINPMAGIVDTFRRAVVLGEGPDPAAIGLSAAAVIVLLPAAYVYFKVTEHTMADLV